MRLTFRYFLPGLAASLPGQRLLDYAGGMTQPDTTRPHYSARPFWRRYWIWGLLAACLALLLGVALYLWLALLSPFGYQAPENLSPLDPNREHRVFVYGTLRSPSVRWLVMGDRLNPEPAVLAGYQKDALDIEPKPSGNVQGLVFNVTPEQLQRLDRYERLGLRYERVWLELADGSRAWVYQRLPN